jgi:hypothetical protein
VPIPAPESGLVIRYGYLWRHEADRRRDHARDRPACIVAAVARQEGEVTVVILPVTRRRPPPATPAIELPPLAKAHLGLGLERSWIIAAECNVDVWPSPDLAQVPGRPGVFAYGLLPPRLFRRVRDAFVAHARSKQLRVVRRKK